MIYFTADWHLGHENIIKYCKRPFDNCEEMEQVIVNNYKNIVTENDKVYFLGDIFWHNKSGYMKSILSILPGNKILIRGNHDKASVSKYIDAGFSVVHDFYIGILYKGFTFYLTHDPAYSQIDRDYNWICGHVHDLFFIQKNVINVGVDMWNFKPVPFDTILNMFLNRHEDY